MVSGALPKAGIFPAATLPADTGVTGPGDTQYCTHHPASLPLPIPLPDACDGANNPQRTTHRLDGSGELRMAPFPGRTRERNTPYGTPSHSTSQESTENC